MTITAKVIEHSRSPDGIDIITVECRYPRFIHSELMTHRVFSRNAASSRAIPISKMLENIKYDMAMPVFWGKNQSGMQAKEELTGLRLWAAQTIWVLTGRIVCFFVWLFTKIGLHKQIANRMLEPWSHITVLVTSTYWANFFALRNHPDAQPEFKELAQKIKWAIEEESTPYDLNYGDWHLPYVTNQERKDYNLEEQKALSVARCASVSYKTVDGKTMTVERALELAKKLVGASPLHASPLEHQATPDIWMNDIEWSSKALWGNFYGWIQNRKLHEKEFVNDFNN